MDLKRIAVFDFNAADCTHTAEAVRTYFADRAEVVEYTVMQDFAYAFKDRRNSGAPYDMVFIGVDSMMGVETARNIREMDDACPMFLVSAVSDFGIEGFRLHALDYLTKPVSSERVGQAARRTGMHQP